MSSRAGFGLIQDELLAQLVRKRLNTTPGFSTLTPELMPVFVVEGPMLEHEFLKGIKRCAARATISAVAAQNSQMALVNPTASNIVAAVQRIIVEPGAAGTFIVYLGRGVEPTLTSAGVTWGPLDMRWTDPLNLTGLPSCRPVAGTRAGAAIVAFDVYRRAAQTTGLELDVNIILRPGSTMTIMHNAVNVALGNVGFEWTERALNPSELV